MPGPDRPAASPRHLGAAFAAALVFVLGLARYAPFIEEPWDNTLASINGAVYMTKIVRSFQYAGFAELRGEPHLWVAPTEHPIGLPYTHHPPLWFWLQYLAVQAIGWSELAFRALPVVLSAAAAAAFFVLASAHVGRAWGFAAAILFLVLPLSFRYGWMAVYESPVLACSVIAFLLHDRLRTRPLRSWWPVLIPCFLAPQIDWQGAFIGPGLLVSELLQPRGQRRAWRVLLLAGATAVLSVAVVVGTYAWWAGGSGGVSDLIVTARAAAVAWPAGWLRTQGAFLASLLTWPVLLLACAGLLVAAATSRRSQIARLSLGFLAAGLLNVLVFPLHAHGHDYWWYPVLPAAVSMAVLVLRAAAARSKALAVVTAAVMVAITSWAAVSSLRIHRSYATTVNRDVGRELDTLAGPGDVILFPDDVLCVSFYLRARTSGPLVDPDAVRFLAGARKRHEVLGDRVVVVSSSFFSADATLQPALAKHGSVERLAGEEFRRRFPATARLLPDLTIARLGE